MGNLQLKSKAFLLIESVLLFWSVVVIVVLISASCVLLYKYKTNDVIFNSMENQMKVIYEKIH